MGINFFFERKGPFLLTQIFDKINPDKNLKIYDVKSLDEAENSDITFLDKINYINIARFTKASYCLTTDKLKVY